MTVAARAIGREEKKGSQVFEIQCLFLLTFAFHSQIFQSLKHLLEVMLRTFSLEKAWQRG